MKPMNTDLRQRETNYWLSSEIKKKKISTFKHTLIALVSNGRERWVLVIHAGNDGEDKRWVPLRA